MKRPELWATPYYEYLAIVHETHMGGKVELGYLTLEEGMRLLESSSNLYKDGWMQYWTYYDNEMRLERGWHFLGKL